MWRSLRLKIFGSFLLLILMLALAGAISILQLNWLSSSVHGLIEDNYKSVKASRMMLESLEREDSGVLLFLLDEPDDAKAILNRADSVFMEAFHMAENNQTEKNESEYIRAIANAYEEYKYNWKYLDTNRDENHNIVWYKNNIHDSFKEAKVAVEALMMLNQDKIYESSSAIKDKARRAIMPGIISVIAAIIFSLILNFYISRHFVAPLSKITEAINDTYTTDHHLSIRVNPPGELKKLEKAINQMIKRLSQ